MFRGRGIACRGTSVYRPKHRKEWLEKLNDQAPRHRAERLLKQLDLLGELCLDAQKDLVRESRKHKSYKILREVPGLGPIRAALILAFVMTPHRFRNKRQFWTYTGFSVVRRASAEYEISQGELRRTNRFGDCNNYNHVLKMSLRSSSYGGLSGPFMNFRPARGRWNCAQYCSADNGEKDCLYYFGIMEKGRIIRY
jgi:hypothetical protein